MVTNPYQRGWISLIHLYPANDTGCIRVIKASVTYGLLDKLRRSRKNKYTREKRKKIYPYCDTPALTKSKLGVSKCELETLSCVIYLSRPTTRFKLVAISLINFSNLDATAYRFFSVYIIGDLIRSHAHYIDNDKSAATGRY